jgi:hypothetical protein
MGSSQPAPQRLTGDCIYILLAPFLTGAVSSPSFFRPHGLLSLPYASSFGTLYPFSNLTNQRTTQQMRERQGSLGIPLRATEDSSENERGNMLEPCYDVICLGNR